MAEAAASGPETSVIAALERLAPPGDIGVAVSGGSDSTALLLIAQTWAAHAGRAIRAATVDHGLRPESAAEAGKVADLCAAHGIAHDILTVDAAAGSGNLQARARAARLGALSHWATETGLGCALLGHTLDDQAETVLLRLARGSGMEGLSAMQEMRHQMGVCWLRPMLEVRRNALRGWLGDRQIEWIDDPSNEDVQFDRIKARQALETLAPLGLTPDGLSSTARTLARQRRVLEAAAADLAVQALRWGAFGEARLARAPMRAAERDTALRLFADVLQRIGAGDYRPRFRALEPLFERAMAAADQAAATLSGCLVRPEPDRDRILVCREPAAVEAPRRLSGRAVIWDGRWRVDAPAAPDGFTVGALGPAGRKILRQAAESGLWTPPACWQNAPAIVQETVPAIRSASHECPEMVIAVPSLSYCSEGCSWVHGVRIECFAACGAT